MTRFQRDLSDMKDLGKKTRHSYDIFQQVKLFFLDNEAYTQFLAKTWRGNRLLLSRVASTATQIRIEIVHLLLLEASCHVHVGYIDVDSCTGDVNFASVDLDMLRKSKFVHCFHLFSVLPFLGLVPPVQSPYAFQFL